VRPAAFAAYPRFGCGCSSGVEHNLAKVGVVGSNPIARSKKLQKVHARRRATCPRACSSMRNFGSGSAGRRPSAACSWRGEVRRVPAGTPLRPRRFAAGRNSGPMPIITVRPTGCSLPSEPSDPPHASSARSLLPMGEEARRADLGRIDHINLIGFVANSRVRR
jgi:hypothetical protein